MQLRGRKFSVEEDSEWTRIWLFGHLVICLIHKLC
jgi:hypothetical protein